MKIIVCIKPVIDPTNAKMDKTIYTVVREGVSQILNPADENALEEALRLKDEFGAEVTALAMGNQKSFTLLEKIAALGIGKAYLVSDKCFAGSDTLATSLVLSRAIEYIGDFDLILCGYKAIDGETGQVPPEVAVFLGIPCITNCTSLQIRGKMIKCNQLLETEHQLLKLPMPALISFHVGINSPRLPSIQSLRNAKKIEITILDNSVLKLDLNQCGLNGSPTKVEKLFKNTMGFRNTKRLIGIESIDCLSNIIKESIKKIRSAERYSNE